MKPILFSLGPIHLYSFGMMIFTGIVMALYGMTRLENRPKFFTNQEVADLVFFTLVSGLLGGRLFYVIQNAEWYVGHPLHIFALWEGGLIYYGGVFVFLVALYVLTKRKKISYLQVLDFLIPFGVLTHAFGRIGCFLNGCCTGKACDLPWAVQFPGEFQRVHPTQLYEAFFLLLLFFFLKAKYRRHHFDGEVLVLYLIIYPMFRFFIEYLRADNPVWIFLTINQWVSIVLVAIASLGLYYLKKSGNKNC